MSSQSAAPSWDEIRGILKEVSAEQKEISASQKETARQIKEMSAERREMSAERREIAASQKETARQIKEMSAERREEISASQKERARQIKETARQIKERARQIKERAAERREIAASQKETARQIKEMSAERKEISAERREASRQLDQLQKETARQMKETDRKMKETDRQVKETSKKVKSLTNLFNNQWGALVEGLVSGKMVRLLQGRGIDISDLSENIEIRQNRLSKDGKIRKETVCELDILAENGAECVVVEVKTTLNRDDVKKFAALLPRLAELRPKRFKGKKMYGAVAYLKSAEKAHVLAEEYGFFSIKGTGDSAHIVNKPGFQPKAY